MTMAIVAGAVLATGTAVWWVALAVVLVTLLPASELAVGLTNYLSNLRRLGWTDADLTGGGSDALVDALAVHGDAAAIARGVTAHLEAGADHVAAQVLNPDPLPALRALAGQLQLAPH